LLSAFGFSYNKFEELNTYPMSFNSRRNRTKYIFLDTSICNACWECVNKCPNKVLGKIDFLGHRHAKINDPNECTGCLACIKVCDSLAIVSLTS